MYNFLTKFLQENCTRILHVAWLICEIAHVNSGHMSRELKHGVRSTLFQKRHVLFLSSLGTWRAGPAIRLRNTPFVIRFYINDSRGRVSRVSRNRVNNSRTLAESDRAKYKKYEDEAQMKKKNMNRHRLVDKMQFHLKFYYN